MTGKAARHAEQLPLTNSIFTPSSDAVTHARSVMAAVGAANGGTPVLNGHVVELAMIREAQRVAAIADRLRDGADASSAQNSLVHAL